jgi:5-methylthioadenosine/S-adenosylhomocysteine deaminase
VSDASFRKVATLAAELDLPVHVHLHETEQEVQSSLAEHGMRPLERLRRLNLLGPNLIAVHAVHLNADEVTLLAHHGCSVVHCPSSNLKLASGFAPIAELAAAGVNIALGTDGAASNNRLDLMQEMRTAALLAKAVARDAQAMPAHQALHAATLGGAQALGLGEEIGRIAPGRKADITLLSLRDPAFAPLNDAVRQLVYTEPGRSVRHVIVDGRLVIQDGRATTINEDALYADLERLMPTLLADLAQIRKRNERLLPYVEEAHRRTMALDLGMDRYRTL